MLVAQRDFFHAANHVEHRVAVDRVVGRAELGAAGRQEDVVFVDGLHHIERREVACLQLHPIEIHHDRPDLAAVNQRRDRAGLRHDLGPDLVAADVEQRRLRSDVALSRATRQTGVALVGS